ncbi:MAG TPA: YafY family protein [Gaiellales bacterium]|nr:YafY family protein [Gaiellales bacterium]
MLRSDRLLGILLWLRSGQAVSAIELARRFEVSVRTIYRDVDTLSALGVPVYAVRGRGGGFRLLEGYFLPAIAFTRDEAVSLVVGLTILRRLRTRPLGDALETAQAKLLAAMPAHLGAVLADAARIVGFEALPEDVFHPDLPASSAQPERDDARERAVIDVFLRAILDGTPVLLSYRAAYAREPRTVRAVPEGMFWDSDRWYLAGRLLDRDHRARLWRADRVVALHALPGPVPEVPPFDVRTLLGRAWLAAAMASWAEESAVRLRLTTEQAGRLRRDWYYGHARFDARPDGGVTMTFGEDEPRAVLALLRWLGPGAELLEPAAWRGELRAELARMLADHGDPAPA